jgi:hypothetical protein
MAGWTGQALDVRGESLRQTLPLGQQDIGHIRRRLS